MKHAVIYSPKTPPPAEMLPDMFAGTSAWVEKYGPKMETLYFFAGGGGLGVVDVADSAELQRMLAEHPFTTYVDVSIRPVVEPAVALSTLQEVAAARAGA